MAFAMKGGGGLEGVSSATYLFSQRPELLMNVNFEPIIRGLKSDIFEV